MNASPGPTAVPSKPPRRELPPLLKLVAELGPLAVFFVFNARTDLFTATAAFMVATVAALTLSFALVRRVPVMPLVSGVVVVVFGGLTLLLHDEVFIKLKPTIVNALFAAILLGGLAIDRSPLALVLGTVIRLDAAGWRALTLRWGLFFVAMAVTNEVVWRTFSTDAWVSFKVFGVMPITILFALAQVPLMQRHALPEAASPQEPAA